MSAAGFVTDATFADGTAGQHGSTSIPTMKVVQGGRPVKTLVRPLPKPAFEAQPTEFLAV